MLNPLGNGLLVRGKNELHFVQNQLGDLKVSEHLKTSWQSERPLKSLHRTLPGNMLIQQKKITLNCYQKKDQALINIKYFEIGHKKKIRL